MLVIVFHVHSESMLTDIITCSVSFYVTLNHFVIKVYTYIQIQNLNLYALFDLFTFVSIVFYKNLVSIIKERHFRLSEKS